MGRKKRCRYIPFIKRERAWRLAPKYQPHRKRWKRYEKPKPGHRLQMDVKFLERIPGTAKRLYQFTAIDDCTRIRILKVYDAVRAFGELPGFETENTSHNQYASGILALVVSVSGGCRGEWTRLLYKMWSILPMSVGLCAFPLRKRHTVDRARTKRDSIGGNVVTIHSVTPNGTNCLAEDRKKVAILGCLEVHPIVRLSLSGRRVIALLAVRGESVPRSVASETLWPDLPDEVGRANLRRALWQLPRGWVTAAADQLVLDAETDFPQAHRVAGRALAGERLSFDDIVLLSNDILPGWHEEWVLSAHDAFRLLRVQALEAACRTMAASGEFALATQAGASALAAEPLRESAAEALIDAHLAQHNRYEAIQCFDALARRLKVELGVAPDPGLTQRVESLAVNHPKPPDGFRSRLPLIDRRCGRDDAPHVDPQRRPDA